MVMVHSFNELPDFPYPTYPDFAEAAGQGRALVWVRPDIRAAWRLGSVGDRIGYLVLLGVGWVLAALFAVFTYRLHNGWLLLGLLTSLVGFWCASPAPGIISGGGCLPAIILAVGLIAAPSTHSVSLVIGLAAGMSWFLSWFMASAALGLADGAIREAMVKSEEMFLWLWERRAVVRVERKEEENGFRN